MNKKIMSVVLILCVMLAAYDGICGEYCALS